MAFISYSTFHPTEVNEPTPRFSHCAAAVGGRCYLWGGVVQDFFEIDWKELVSTVEIFDPYLETWEKHPTTGDPPPGLYDAACTSLLDSVYWFGGWDGWSFYNSLHRLDTTTLEWRKVQPLNPAEGPMRKVWCGMVSFSQDKLATFGGYGHPTKSPIQSGATFIKNPFSSGMGWSNELHVFDITRRKWSSPATTGPRPPPCYFFSFTAINNHQAVLFGGNQPRDRRVNDYFLMDFESMHWTKLEKTEGAPWPVGRDSHAACCLNFGEEDPQLLVTGGVDESVKVTGGVDNNGNTLSDAWILDVKSRRWRELTLHEAAQTRLRHTTTAISLEPGRTQVIMFGGCPNWEQGKPDYIQQKLAITAVLEFESLQSSSSGGTLTIEWVLKGVIASQGLGTPERFEEMRQRKTEHADLDEAGVKDQQVQTEAVEIRGQHVQVDTTVVPDKVEVGDQKVQTETVEIRDQQDTRVQKRGKVEMKHQNTQTKTVEIKDQQVQTATIAQNQAHIRGVEVIAQETFTITQEAVKLNFEGYGFKLCVPENSLPAEVSEAQLSVQVSLSGSFQMPSNCELASAVYWVSSPHKFIKPMTVEIQHCAALSSSEQCSQLTFVHTKCTQKELPYIFKEKVGGVFTPNSSYGSLSLSHFSGIGIVISPPLQRSFRIEPVQPVIPVSRQTINSELGQQSSEQALDSQQRQQQSLESSRQAFDSDLGQQPQQQTSTESEAACQTQQEEGGVLQYCAQLYITCKLVTEWKVDFVVTKDLESCLTVVQEKYISHGQPQFSFNFRFKEDFVSLKIPEKGELGGWEITPFYDPEITRQQVNCFSSGKRIPKCELLVQWSKKIPPARLQCKIGLIGARDRNYFLLHINPDADISTTSVGGTASPSSTACTTSSEKVRQAKVAMQQLICFKTTSGRISVLEQIGPHYRELGILLLDDTTGAVTKAILEQYNYDATKIIFEIFERWIQGKGKLPVEWDTLIEVLNDIELPELANKIKAKTSSE